MLLPILPSCLLVAVLAAGHAEDPWLTFEGGEGPGKGKHVVFVSGDDEYRSEEAFPMLARILSKRFGYKCTVLFAVDPATGTIQPDHPHNIPGTHLLAGADRKLGSRSHGAGGENTFGSKLCGQLN